MKATIAASLSKKCPEAGLLLRDGAITPREALRIASLRPKDRPAALAAAQEAARTRPKPPPPEKKGKQPAAPRQPEVVVKHAHADAEATEPRRPTVAIRARWRHREGLLHISEEYALAEFRRDLGGMPERTLASLRPRLRELRPTSALLDEVLLRCEHCGAWHLLDACPKPPTAPLQHDPPAAPQGPGLPAFEAGLRDGRLSLPPACRSLEYTRGYAKGVGERAGTFVSASPGPAPGRADAVRTIPSAADPGAPRSQKNVRRERREIIHQGVALWDTEASLFLPEDLDAGDAAMLASFLRSIATTETPSERALAHDTVRLRGCQAVLCLPQDVTRADIVALIDHIAQAAPPGATDPPPPPPQKSAPAPALDLAPEPEPESESEPKPAPEPEPEPESEPAPAPEPALAPEPAPAPEPAVLPPPAKKAPPGKPKPAVVPRRPAPRPAKPPTKREGLCPDCEERMTVLAGFEPQWPDLSAGVAGFEGWG